MTINIEKWHIAVGTDGKSVIIIKGAQSYSFSYEYYLYLPFSLACLILSCLYYGLLGHTLNLFPFLIKSKINNLTECFLSMHFLWILYFTLRLLQHGDIELNPGPQNIFLSATGT